MNNESLVKYKECNICLRLYYNMYKLQHQLERDCEFDGFYIPTVMTIRLPRDGKIKPR